MGLGSCVLHKIDSQRGLGLIDNVILTIQCQKSRYGATPPSPPSARFYCYCRPPENGRSGDGLWYTVRCGASQDSNQFLVRGHTECGVCGFSVGPALLLFLSGLIALHRSEQIAKTIALYYSPSKYCGRYILDLVIERQKTERTLVLDSPPGPQFNQG